MVFRMIVVSCPGSDLSVQNQREKKNSKRMPKRPAVRRRPRRPERLKYSRRLVGQSACSTGQRKEGRATPDAIPERATPGGTSVWRESGAAGHLHMHADRTDGPAQAHAVINDTLFLSTPRDYFLLFLLQL